jgi:hypothetical protein
MIAITGDISGFSTLIPQLTAILEARPTVAVPTHRYKIATMTQAAGCVRRRTAINQHERDARKRA